MVWHGASMRGYVQRMEHTIAGGHGPIKRSCAHFLALAMAGVFWYKVALCAAGASFGSLSHTTFIGNPASFGESKDHD
jgi:hypothetical protein